MRAAILCRASTGPGTWEVLSFLICRMGNSPQDCSTAWASPGALVGPVNSEVLQTGMGTGVAAEGELHAWTLGWNHFPDRMPFCLLCCADIQPLVESDSLRSGQGLGGRGCGQGGVKPLMKILGPKVKAQGLGEAVAARVTPILPVNLQGLSFPRARRAPAPHHPYLPPTTLESHRLCQ